MKRVAMLAAAAVLGTGAPAMATIVVYQFDVAGTEYMQFGDKISPYTSTIYVTVSSDTTYPARDLIAQGASTTNLTSGQLTYSTVSSYVNQSLSVSFGPAVKRADGLPILTFADITSSSFSVDAGNVPAGLGFVVVDGRVTGVTTSFVPECATWAMMLTGFGAIGAATRRVRSSRQVTELLA